MRVLVVVLLVGIVGCGDGSSPEDQETLALKGHPGRTLTRTCHRCLLFRAELPPEYNSLC